MEVNERKINRMILYEVALDVKLQAFLLYFPAQEFDLRYASFSYVTNMALNMGHQGEGWIRQAEELKHAQWPVERIDFALNKLRILRNGEAHDRPDIYWQDWQQEVTGTGPG